MPASTVHRVLVRHGLNRLDHLDRVTRAPIRRIVMTRPGELVHVDIKKLGRIPKGGGWRVHGRTARPSTYKKRKARIGYAYVHSAIDGYSRLAYTEVLANEQGRTASEFITRALAFFANHDITVERILTDTGPAIAVASSPTRSASSTTPSPGPTDPRPTARWNGSTGPC
jgi:hypothetical protein